MANIFRYNEILYRNQGRKVTEKMKLYSGIKESNTVLHEIYIEDNFQEHTNIIIKQEIFEKKDLMRTSRHTLHASGFHICESFIQAYDDISNEFHATGPHIRFFFYFKGSSTVKNGAGGSSYQHDVGVLQRNFLDNEGSGGVINIKKGDEVLFIIIKMSHDFYINLLRDEPWIRDDAFHKYILSKKPQNRPNEFINMNMNMDNTLRNIMNSKYIINNRYHYIKIKLRELLFYIHQETTYGRNFMNEISEPMMETLESIKSYLSINSTSPPTISQLAKDFKVNEKKLKQYFKYVYGMTIYSFVIQTRMEKAKHYLLEGHNVNELAALLGYQNVSHFIQVFKKHYGYTPKEALKKYQSNT